MEKKKYDLCLQVLRRMRNVGILDKIMIVGSWCVVLYEDYFAGKAVLPAIRTRDLDFLFPFPFKSDVKTDLCDLLKDLGFLEDYRGNHGYMSLLHPELTLEFLIPQRVKESDKPRFIPQLGINAQPLRFMDIPFRDPQQLPFGDVTVTVPHPIDFALHKLLIAGRRKNTEKAEKDRNQAVAVLTALHENGETERVRSVYDGMLKRWRKTIVRELVSLEEDQLLEVLQLL